MRLPCWHILEWFWGVNGIYIQGVSGNGHLGRSTGGHMPQSLHVASRGRTTRRPSPAQPGTARVKSSEAPEVTSKFQEVSDFDALYALLIFQGVYSQSVHCVLLEPL